MFHLPPSLILCLYVRVSSQSHQNTERLLVFLKIRKALLFLPQRFSTHKASHIFELIFRLRLATTMALLTASFAYAAPWFIPQSVDALL